MKNFLNYLKQIVLGLIIVAAVLFSIPIMIGISSALVSLVLSPVTIFSIEAFGFHSIYSWFVMPILIIDIFLFPLILMRWVLKDSKKFRALGVQTSPSLWALGVLLPTSIICFPLYLIRRNITWVGGHVDEEIVKSNLKSRKKLIIFGTIFGIFLIYCYGRVFIVAHRFDSSFKPLISFIVKNSLTNDCKGRRPCNELRPLPKPLQGKKIVFDSNTQIKFDPYDRINDIDDSELDVRGLIDAQFYFQGEKSNYIDPVLEKYGDLEEREYKIIRAVYSYKCSYCVDSSDLGYIVLEDPKGNRFIDLLDDLDFSVSPARNLSWDELLPDFMGTYGDGSKMSGASLVDVN